MRRWRLIIAPLAIVLGIVFEEADPPYHLQISACFQSRDCGPQHAVTKMALSNAQHFGATPFLLDPLDLFEWRDRIELACNKQSPGGVT